MRNNFLDWLKGILILLVIVGHILQGSLQDNEIRYFIYSFHMPLFFGLTGFLLNTNKLALFSIIDVFNNYKYRILVPFLIASFCYFNFFFYFNPTNSYFQDIINFTFINTFYHLWFIPSFLCFIIVYWIFLKLKIETKKIVVISLIISIFFLLLEQFTYLHSEVRYLSKLLRIIQHVVRPHFFFFFILGSTLKNYKIAEPKKLIYVMIPFFILNGFHLLNLHFIANKFIYLISNSLLVIFIFSYYTNTETNLNNKVKWFGTNSLGLYLWHIFPILLAKLFFTNDIKNYYVVEQQNLLSFYIIVIIFELLFLYLYFKLSKLNFFKKYFFGM